MWAPVLILDRTQRDEGHDSSRLQSSPQFTMQDIVDAIAR